MKIYFSGITGTGLGPLALFAKGAGCEVVGSDLAKGAIYDELVEAGIEVSIGEQDGKFLEKHLGSVDWFVYTSALPEDHKELAMARRAGVRCSKRDELTEYLIEENGFEMVAIAGTHGKTTTTAMIVWLAEYFGYDISYVVGTTLGFAPSGKFAYSRYFVYEADEYDRNFLRFRPGISVITEISYDHPDIYKNKREYKTAFLQFMAQTDLVLDGRDTRMFVFSPEEIQLAGTVRRKDAQLAIGTFTAMFPWVQFEIGLDAMIDAMGEFPGVGRRFERLTDGFYSDYAHHPEEIRATIEIALDECRMRDYKGIVAVYEPHQNLRQKALVNEYKDAFSGVEYLYWLPTFLVREDPDVPVLTPEELIAGLSNAGNAEASETSDELFSKLLEWRDKGYLVLLMTAGPADGWLRGKVATLDLRR